jgi:uncharacterized damage-inducible protein DinB
VVEVALAVASMRTIRSDLPQPTEPLMNVIDRDILQIPTGYHTVEAALTMTELDDQTALLMRDLEGITPAELEWQMRPGMNTIGMLLAHIAVVELFWIRTATQRKSVFETADVLGIGMDDDGMPLPEGHEPPLALAGRSLDFFRDLITRARAFAKQAAAALSDQDLGTEFQRTRRNGTVEELNVRWVLYHMLEHFSGHYGQILLLRHLYRDAMASR